MTVRSFHDDVGRVGLASVHGDLKMRLAELAEARKQNGELVKALDNAARISQQRVQSTVRALENQLRDAHAEIDRLRLEVETLKVRRDEQGVAPEAPTNFEAFRPPAPKIKAQLPLLPGLKPDVLAKVKEERDKHIAAHGTEPKRKVLAAAVGISVSRLGDYLRHIRNPDR